MMKNYTKVLVFAAIVALVIVPAHAAGTDTSGLCDLIVKMQGVFKVLRVLAFLGAGFYIADWAWEFIKGGKDASATVDDLKKKGTGLLIGFTLLFIIGVVLSFVLSAAGEGGSLGCTALSTGW